MSLRSLAVRVLDDVLERTCAPIEPAGRALVLAPHPDDETLGCGGTVARLRAQGHPVSVIAFTDGRGSHPNHADPDELVRQRANELLNAAHCLGLRSEDVQAWNFPDGALRQHEALAVRRLRAAVDELRPETLFVPLPVGEHPDHIAAYWIARSALRGTGTGLDVFEYPVWFWRHAPWVSPPPGQRRALLRTSLARGFGAQALSVLNAKVDVRSQLDAKRRALAAHASQVADPSGAAAGLRTVCDGTFLARFFTGTEFFRRSAW
ncbi:MAG: PIG-L family deacetylase [Myxococcales bacterium]|nr:PIG-L family deacetylase [Myxococcales bacterium]